MFEKVYRCNAIMMLHKFYYLVSHRSHLGHNKSHFLVFIRINFHWIHVNTLGVEKWRKLFNTSYGVCD